jgi:hypothetical protein
MHAAAQLCEAPNREATSEKGDVPAIIKETKVALSTFENGAGLAVNFSPAPPYKEDAPEGSTPGVIQGNDKTQIATIDFANQPPSGGVSASSNKTFSDISSQGYLASQASTSSERFGWGQNSNSTRDSLPDLCHGNHSALPFAGEEPGLHDEGSTISISTDESRPISAPRQTDDPDEFGEGMRESMQQPIESNLEPSTPLPTSPNVPESARGINPKERSSIVVDGMKAPHRQSALDACLGRGRKTAPRAVDDPETGTHEEVLEIRSRWPTTRVFFLRVSIVVGVLSVAALVILLAHSKDKTMTRASLTGCSLVLDAAIIVGMVSASHANYQGTKLTLFSDCVRS